jgi:hypothetical protein
MTGRLRFCLLLALAMLALRLLSFDADAILSLQAPPNHDMLQGAAFFTTNMHNVRLNGDLAWWNPASFSGYAQYYQAFFSPLAPTPGHIVHILWSQLIRALALFDLAIPEYIQYLIVNYLILPYLAICAFICFAALWLRTRAALILVALIYTLSAIGVWHSAWFYFQEPFTFFMLATATLAVLRRPTGQRMLAWSAAALIQIASLNYWSLYNLFFYIIIVGAFIWVYPHRLRRLFRRLYRLIWRYQGRTTAALVLVGLTAGLWAVMLVSIFTEQRAVNLRDAYTIGEAESRVPPMPRYTLDLFNRQIERDGIEFNWEYVHFSRYIGAFTLPLLVVFAVGRWGRRERWLIAVAGATLLVCFAPPLLLALWQTIPMMNNIFHQFYFYTHYWQIGLALIAAVAFDRLVRGELEVRERRRIVWAMGALGVMAAAILALGFVLATEDSERFAPAALLIGGVALLVWRAAAEARPARVWIGARGLLIAGLLGIALTDLSGYFRAINLRDQAFTVGRWGFGMQQRNADAVQERLRQPWADPDRAYSFQGNLFDNFPIVFTFWLHNNYMKPRALVELETLDRMVERDLMQELVIGVGVQFYPAESVRHEDDVPPGEWATDFETTLTLFDAPPGATRPDFAALPTGAPSVSLPPAFRAAWLDWKYNDTSDVK